MSEKWKSPPSIVDSEKLTRIAARGAKRWRDGSATNLYELIRCSLVEAVQPLVDAADDCFLQEAKPDDLTATTSRKAWERMRRAFRDVIG